MPLFACKTPTTTFALHLTSTNMATNGGEKNAEQEGQTNGVRPEDSGGVPSALAAAIEARGSVTAKDISLKDFLNKMDDYAPIVGFPPV